MISSVHIINGFLEDFHERPPAICPNCGEPKGDDVECPACYMRILGELVERHPIVPNPLLPE